MLIPKHPFEASALYPQTHETMRVFLSRRWSFWLALFSCIAFLIGNMVGQHGWSAFWKSVWGKEAEIVFSGAVYPIAELPGADLHDRRVVSIHHLGDYESGEQGKGSHPGVDILAESGTPVLAMMNGVVERTELRDWGFGNTIVLRHPLVPDPDRPGRNTTLYSVYGHLESVLVEEGEIVRKGRQIGTVGDTGLATTTHLHAQIDKGAAPFHPYWPFTTTEASGRGFDFSEAVNRGLGREKADRYTVDPLAYVRTYRTWSEGAVAVKDDGALRTAASDRGEGAGKAAEPERTADGGKRLSPLEMFRSLLANVEERKTKRLARLREREIASVATAPVSAAQTALAGVGALQGSGERGPAEQPAGEPSTAPADIPLPVIGGPVAAISMLHDGEFDSDWEQIVLFARDGEGNFVKAVRFEGELSLRTVFGDADFSPSVLTEEQFDDRGRAFVRMLPKGRKTIIPAVGGAFTAQGQPMVSVLGSSSSSVSAEASRGRGG